MALAAPQVCDGPQGNATQGSLRARPLEGPGNDPDLLPSPGRGNAARCARSAQITRRGRLDKRELEPRNGTTCLRCTTPARRVDPANGREVMSYITDGARFDLARGFHPHTLSRRVLASRNSGIEPDF